MEYECYHLDLTKKMYHVEGEPLFASNSLGECFSFIHKKFDADGIPICIFQPRWETYRGFLGHLDQDTEYEDIL